MAITNQVTVAVITQGLRRSVQNAKLLKLISGCCTALWFVVGAAQAAVLASDLRSIESVSSNEEGLVFVLGGENLTPNSSCVNTFVIAHNAPNAQRLKAVVTAAESGGKRVSVIYSSEELDCHVLALDASSG